MNLRLWLFLVLNLIESEIEKREPQPYSYQKYKLLRNVWVVFELEFEVDFNEKVCDCSQFYPVEWSENDSVYPHPRAYVTFEVVIIHLAQSAPARVCVVSGNNNVGWRPHSNDDNQKEEEEHKS